MSAKIICRPIIRVAIGIKKIVISVLVFMFCITSALLTGCKGVGDKEVRKNIEFTVCDDTRLPDELKQIIEEKKGKMFKLTYISGEYLYIAVGYGEHSRATYSVVVNDLFSTENALYFDADLRTEEGTKSDAANNIGAPSMYPYIVIKCEKINKPVVFNVD